MLIGYARVSTTDQTLDPQLDELKAAGCEKIFTDYGISGAKANRPGLDECLEYLRSRDVLVIVKLDRLGRTLKHLIATIEDLAERDIGFKSLNDAIDTTTPTGKLVFHIIGAVAEFERDLIRERTMKGLDAARVRGRKGGRKKTYTDDQIEAARRLSQDKALSITQICKMAGISRGIYYRVVAPKLQKAGGMKIE